MIQVTFQKDDSRMNQEILWNFFQKVYERAFPKTTEEAYVALARSVKNYMMAEEMEKTNVFPQYVRDFLERKEMDVLRAQQGFDPPLVNKLKKEHQGMKEEYLAFFEKFRNENVKDEAFNQMQLGLKTIAMLPENERITEVPKRNHEAFLAIEKEITDANQKNALQKLWYSYLEMRILSFQTVEQLAIELLSQRNAYPVPNECPSYLKGIHALNALDEFGISHAFFEDIASFMDHKDDFQTRMDQDSKVMMKMSDYFVKGTMELDLLQNHSSIEKQSLYDPNMQQEFLEEYLFSDEAHHLK